MKQLIEGLTPMEKLFLVNHLGYAIENEDPSALAILVRNPKIIDLILNMQEEVKALLEKPELITQGSRDPFARNYSGLNQDRRFTSTYYGNDDANTSEIDQENENKNGVSIDPAILAKLTFKEIMELDKLLKLGMPSTSLVKKLEEGLSQGNKKQVLNSLLRTHDNENEAIHSNGQDLSENESSYGRPSIRPNNPEHQFRSEMRNAPYMNPQPPNYPYQQANQGLPQPSYQPQAFVNYPVNYHPGYFPPMRMDGQGQAYPMQPGIPGMMHHGQPMAGMQMSNPYMHMYGLQRPGPPMMAPPPPHMPPPQPPAEQRSNFQKPPNPFITNPSGGDSK